MSDRQVRIGVIDSLCEEYVEAIGEMPDSWQLQRLANEILREELTSTSGHKAKKPYSFLSDRQMETRYRQEASFKFTEEYDTDGKFQGRPIRKYKRY